MTEPKVEMYEFNVFGDDPKMHLKLLGPGKPVLADMAEALGLVSDAGDLWAKTQLTKEPPPDEPHVASKPKQDDTPHCKATGVWAAAKGRWPEGFKPDWKHKETRINKKGELYCPTPIDKDENGELIWCGWRAVQREDGTWEEWNLNATED